MPISWSAKGFVLLSRFVTLRGPPRIGLALAATVVPFAPATGAAQEIRTVEWTEASRMELPTSLGLLVRALPGLSTENQSRHGDHQ